MSEEQPDFGEVYDALKIAKHEFFMAIFDVTLRLKDEMTDDERDLLAGILDEIGKNALNTAAAIRRLKTEEVPS